MLHRVDHTTVQHGRVSVSGIALPDGEPVDVLVLTPVRSQKRSISAVRELLRGGVAKYDFPFESSIPEESWEMLK